MYRNNSTKPQKLAKFSSLFMVTLIFLMLFAVQHVKGINPETNDCFYLPLVDNEITLNGHYDEDEWEDANYFTFGTEGHPEVKVYGQYYQETYLYLIFQIKLELAKDGDRLTICIDSNNSGLQDNGLLRIDLDRIHISPTFYTWEDGWVQVPGDDEDPYYDTFKMKNDTDDDDEFWEVEVCIDYSDSNPLTIDPENMGLYFQALDFIDDDNEDYFRHYWPITAEGDNADESFVPPANEWANGLIILNETTPCRPDIYFEYFTDLFTDIDNEVINCNGTNTVTAIIYHRLNGNSEINTGQLGVNFQYAAEVTVTNCETEELETSVGFTTIEAEIDWNPDLPNIPETASITYEPNCSDPLIPALRAELSYENDAITSNNATQRSIEYLEIDEGETVTIEVAIAICDEDEYAVNNEHVLYASTMMTPLQQQSRKILYFYLDRSGLDPAFPDSAWAINFIPAAGDSIIELADGRYELFYIPREIISLSLQFTAPYYPAPEYDGICPVFDLFKCKKLAADTALNSQKAATNKVLAEQPNLQTAEQSSNNLSKLFFKVYREKQTFTDGRKTFRLMETLGYFGAQIKVLQQAVSIYVYIVICLAIIILLIILYYLIKAWKQRKEWDWGKYTISIIIMAVIVIVFNLIVLLSTI